MTADTSPHVLLDAMRAGARDVLQWPLDPQALGHALERAAAQSTRRDTDDTRIVSFMSCKGGAGTSFAASNLAFEIAEGYKRRVLLIDLNQQFADAAFSSATRPRRRRCRSCARRSSGSTARSSTRASRT